MVEFPFIAPALDTLNSLHCGRSSPQTRLHRGPQLNHLYRYFEFFNSYIAKGVTRTFSFCLIFPSLFQYKCLCKANVVGRTCDRCLHGFFNFSGSNPSGCSACRCSTRGTISGTRHCHAQNGRCDCKNHVIGAKCDQCRDGYHGIKQHDIFGCKGMVHND